MSFLTLLPRDRYDRRAFAGFDTTKADYDAGNAHAMAWMCQLSYETADPDKIGSIAKDWRLDLVEGSIISEESATVLPISSTHLIVARRADATIIAFAGTDPISLANWITDFDLGVTSSGASQGLATATQSVLPKILKILESEFPVGPIYVTGHSLGAALAAIAAINIRASFPERLRAVYALGMLRAGDSNFASAYNVQLGAQTFRLVHGEDLVPSVPPSDLGLRHVGRLLTCARLGRFDKNELAESTDSDEPLFVKGASLELRDLSISSASDRLKLAAELAVGINPAGLRTDPGGIAIELLPPRLRDHMPDRYIAATKVS
jgi:lipase (class 3)